MAKKSGSQPTKKQARADAAAARARLSGGVRELIDEVHPRRVVQRQVGEARTAARSELQTVKAQIKDEDGWRWDRIALVGGALGGVLTLVLVLRAVLKRR